VDCIIGQENIQEEGLDSIRSGTLCEVGNILINAVLGTISNELRLNLEYTVPVYQEGTAQALNGKGKPSERENYSADKNAVFNRKPRNKRKYHHLSFYTFLRKTKTSGGSLPGVGSMREHFSVFDHLPIGVAITDSNFRILFWNTSMELWTGWGRHEMIGASLLGPLSPFTGKSYQARTQFAVGDPFAPYFFPPTPRGFFSPSPSRGNRRIQQVTVTFYSPSSDEASLIFPWRIGPNFLSGSKRLG